MDNASKVKPGMEVVGADGVHVGVVEALDGDRIKLAKRDPAHGGESKHSHYIPVNDIASTEGGKLWMSATAALVPLNEEEEKSGKPIPFRET